MGVIVDDERADPTPFFEERDGSGMASFHFVQQNNIYRVRQAERKLSR